MHLQPVTMLPFIIHFVRQSIEYNSKEEHKKSRNWQFLLLLLKALNE